MRRSPTPAERSANYGCPAGRDSFMELYTVDANGALVELLNSDDDGAGALCSRIERNADLDAGAYALLVRDLGNRDMNAYVLDRVYARARRRLTALRRARTLRA